ncbi:hypothetical protein ACQUSY_06080 [Microbacterium sp. YY-03]|uniref:hypothetical protein n=1 Tax=Microbacterium sp. YY-03 TaxID=3421636 RepID=UPI003D1824B7
MSVGDGVGNALSDGALVVVGAAELVLGVGLDVGPHATSDNIATSAAPLHTSLRIRLTLPS